MGVGVLDMVEMYATGMGDTQATMMTKEPSEPLKSYSKGTKRRISSTISEDSGLPTSPRTVRSSRSSRNSRKAKHSVFHNHHSSSSDRTNSSSSRYSYTPTFGVTPHNASTTTTTTSTSYLTSTDTEDEGNNKALIHSRLEIPSGSTSSSSSNMPHRMRDSSDVKRRRFVRTAEALRHSGLLDITMKTAELLRKNQDLQKEIENLQNQTKNFVISVLHNPENRTILNSVRSQSQLYELLVPGSQELMSVQTSLSNCDLQSSLNCMKIPNSQDDEDSLASNGNGSSPSPAPTESDGFSSLSEDSDSSEKDTVLPPTKKTATSSQTPPTED